MIRVRREKPTFPEIDLTIPVKKSEIQTTDEDCFSHLWDPYAKECGACADNELCAILYSQNQKKKVAKVQEGNTTFLDLTDFKAFDAEKVKNAIVEYEKDGEPMRVEELSAHISKKCRTEDQIAINQHIIRFVRENNLKIKSGQILQK